MAAVAEAAEAAATWVPTPPVYHAVVIRPLPHQPEVIPLRDPFSDDHAKWYLGGKGDWIAVRHLGDVSIIFSLINAGRARNALASMLFGGNYWGTVIVVPRDRTLLHRALSRA